MVRSFLCALVVLGLSVTFVGADEKPVVGARNAPADVRAVESKPMECEFVKFNEKTHELTVKVEGKEKTLKCAETCKCTCDAGNMMKLTELKSGSKVKLMMEKDSVVSIQCVK